MKKECPNCAMEVPETAGSCPICRYEFPERRAFPWKPVAALLLLILAFPLVRALWRLIDR